MLCPRSLGQSAPTLPQNWEGSPSVSSVKSREWCVCVCVRLGTGSISLSLTFLSQNPVRFEGVGWEEAWAGVSALE